MPQRNSSRRLIIRLVLFTLAGWLLWALGKDDAQAAEPETVTPAVPESSEPTHARAKAKSKASGFSKRRLATTLAFTTLFFAGAAFSAGAGDLVVGALEGSSACVAEPSAEGEPVEPCDDAPPAEEEPAEEPAPEESSSDEASEPAPEPTQTGEESAEEPAGQGDEEPVGEGESGDGGDEPAQDGEPAGEGDSGSGGSDGSGDPSSDPSDPGQPEDEDDEWEDEPLDDEPDAGPGSPAHAGDAEEPEDDGATAGLTNAENSHRGLDFDGGGYGVVWLHRTLPDPTPPAARLAPGFARALLQTSRVNHVDWALVLGVLRASGHKNAWPASEQSLRQLASRLYRLKANADEWRAALALGGRTSFADRAIALTRYNRAVGLRALTRGLLAEKAALEARVLGDPRVSIYAGGRADIASGRINVRVLVLLLYLAEAHGQVTVSSLNSGHRLYARPGVISAHKYGLAVDIAALGGSSILGNQDPGGLTERAVRNILLLPVEVKPNQVISLLGLGGPSFPLADHYDHIHVGY
jgi:hypothetical protein